MRIIHIFYYSSFHKDPTHMHSDTNIAVYSPCGPGDKPLAEHVWQ